MRIAVVGLGGMGQSHVAAAGKCPGVSKIAGCDISEKLRAGAAEKFGIGVFADVPTLLREFHPQAVTVATPPNRHAEVIRACLTEGIPVLTEKPICTNLAESEELVKLAAQKKIPFQCCFQARCGGVARAMHAVIDAGELGKLKHAGLIQISGTHAAEGYMTRERAGGIFYEKLCHQTDWFRYFLGEPRRVLAIASPNAIAHYGIEDNAMAIYEFEGGAQGTIKFDTRRAAQVEKVGGAEKAIEGRDAGHFYELSLTGERGTAVYDAWTEKLEVLRFNHRADRHTERVRIIDVRAEFGEPSYDLVTQDGEFYSRVMKGEQPRFPAEDALKSMRWVERSEESLRRGGVWIEA